MKNGTALLSMIALLALGLASPALAVDGVLEINQACAVSTGCFSGDAAGLPVTITAAGSYRLTSNLTVPDENTDGIVVSADDVGIDLNNFAIIGPVTCSGTPLTCSPTSGTGSGIERSSSGGISIRGTSVKNGSITGVGYIGVALGEEAEVTNVHVRWCAAGGISADKYSTVSGNRAHSNGFGIAAGDGSVISGNTISKNSSYGIVTFKGSTVSGNAVSSNGIDGIFVEEGSVVSGNTVRKNTGYGIRFQGTAGYSGNVISNNTAGTVTGTVYAVEFGQNVCDGNTTCP